MQNLVKKYVTRFAHEKASRRKLASVLVVLSLVVAIGVSWQLKMTAVALTNDTSCGLEEHTHTEECYTQVLVCELEESEGHTHTDDCYEEQTVLVCDLEESEGHTHGEDCYDEEGNLTCGLKESEGHTHTDACYETQTVLVCQLEESEGHTHTDACYEKQLTCGKIEHTHTVECMSDETADVETEDNWEATLPDDLTGIWAEDVVAIAESQLGYTESTANYVLDDDGTTRRGYTRYGAWAGNKYGDWDAMFASFCLHYAGLSKEDFPEATGAYAWSVTLQDEELYESAEEYTPLPGDLVFFDTDEDDKIDRVGIVSEVDEEEYEISVIEGDYKDAVCENEYAMDDEMVIGYGVLPEQEEIEAVAEDEEEEEYQTLYFEGEDYTVTVGYDADAELPENVELIVSEYDTDSVTYQARYEEAAELYGWDEDAENEFRLFDICLYADGMEVEPAAKVDVIISYMDKNDLTEYNVTHYGDTETETLNASSDYADGTQSISFRTDGFTDYGVSPASNEVGASSNDTNQSYVSALIIQTTIDGTDPFDTNDDAGNDSSASNGIVRSFDYVNYTLEYTTALMDNNVTVDSAYMMISFELDCDPSVAEFNSDTLNWCLDQEVTYTYSDGSTSTTWDSSKTVTKQVLTGKRYLSVNAIGDNAIPGDGTLSVGIYVKAAQNGDTLKPTFTVWMEGNEESLQKSVTGNEITVSAAPRYNISLTRNSSCDYLGYWNFNDGTVSSTQTSADEVYGRMEGYGIVIQLYNDSEDKGLKGIELPTGEITFTVTLTATLDDVDVTSETNYEPLLWDYLENTPSSTTKKGKLGRSMCFGNINNSSYGVNVAGSNGGTANSCYESGTWAVTQSGNVLSVTVSGYEFDLDDFDFPTRGLGDNTTTTRYGENIGCFSAGYIQVLASYPDSVSSTSDYEFKVTVAEMKATSVSGQTAEVEAVTDDNTSTIALTLSTKGTIEKLQWYGDSTGTLLCSNYEYGDAYSYQDAEITILSRMQFSGDGTITSFNLLQKFDDKALEVVPTEGTGYLKYSKGQSLSVIDSITVLYAAKPGGTGWVSDQEMNEAKEENLIFFTSYDDLVTAGYTCVGFLYEVRGTIYPMTGNGLSIYMKMNVKEDATIGSVYQTVNTLRAWRSDDAVSWTTIPYTGNSLLTSGVYGLGSSTWTGSSATDHDEYASGYSAPTYVRYNSSGSETPYRYTKVTYENGTIVSGHTGSYSYGNSLLIIGCKTGVSVTVADETSTTEGTTSKEVYDLDKGERTVTYTVDPTVAVVSENREVEDSNDTTNITVTVTLPEGLTYNYDANIIPTSVTKNSDGTTTIIWTFNDVTIGTSAGLNDITFSCTIGEAGTANDVNHADTLTISAAITSDKDSRECTTANGNYSETTISVIKLASSSISKTVTSNLLEVGEDITFYLHYGNSASVAVSGVDILDILPYNNDGRGTSYSGTYTLKSVTVDFSSAENTYNLVKSLVSASYTTDTTVGSEDPEDILKGSSAVNFTTLSNATTNDNAKTVTWSNLSISDVTALYLCIGDVQPNEYVTVQITLSVVDDSGELLEDSDSEVQQPGNIYTNNFYQYATNQAAVVESNTVKTTVVQRDLSGLVWKDTDRDGAREDGESLYSGLTVSLYRTEPSSYDADETVVITIGDVSLYTAYNVLGQNITPATTDEKGEYSFKLLEAGTYYVVINGGDTSDPITDYGLTIQDSSAASSDNFDSDAAGTISGGTLQNAYIIVTMPAAEEMTGSYENSVHNDAGLTLAELVIKKVSENNEDTALEGALFTLTDSNGNYYYSDGTTSASKIELTTGNDGLITVDNLKAGTYTLTEIQAPDGYSLPDSHEWTVTVQAVYDETVKNWFTQSYISDTAASTSSPYKITNASGYELPSAGGPGAWPYVLAGLALCGTAVLVLNKRRKRA